MVYELCSSFDVLVSSGMDLGASSWFQMEMGESLLMVIVTILVYSGPMVEIIERVAGSIWEYVKRYLW